MSIPSELPEGWAWATLGDIADSTLGKMLDRKKEGDHPVPYLRNVNVQWGRIDTEDVLTMSIPPGQQDFFRVRRGDLLVCEGGEVGRCAVFEGDDGKYLAFQKALHRVRPLGGVSSSYLRYYLEYLNVTGGFGKFTTGSTIKHLPQQQLKRLPVRVPPLEEQRRIVAMLEEQISKIESGERGLAKSSRRSVQYRRLVADLATKGKLAEALVDEGTGHALVESIRHARIGVVKGRRLKAAPLGGPVPEVPGNWTVASLDEVSALIEYGSSTKTSEMAKAGDVPVLRMGNIQDGKIDPRVLKYIPAGHPDAAKFSLEDGDLLFNRTNSIELVGKSAVYRGELGRMVFASYLIRCRFLPGVDPEWVNLVINSPMGRRYIRSVATQQVGQANVNGTKLGGMPIPLPPEAEQRRILDVVESHHSAALRLNSGIRQQGVKAALLRRSFLTEAFAGRLVPQDSADEPAEALFARIRAEREAAGAYKARRRSPRRAPAQQKHTLDTAPASDAPPHPRAGAPTLTTATQPTLDLEMPS
ncbi:restriction endonuclease subunit S [Streptomyces edwardsiae]|uniref:Restriction endonuclease subunit S n=1 Tax=Streptomyces edwardsiae TaxID=3075527 RepID=A0ABU2QGL1_9ACTN|nr:restriction endonuclease subunit S [Streptomyces sp. DSM 41635]MDT0402620.1 restriction endonuclease subunit S [Streptomyces sp. DSM 41635]